MTRKLPSAALAALLLASPVFADTWTIDKNHSEAGFQIRHLMSRVRGQQVSRPSVALHTRPEESA